MDGALNVSSSPIKANAWVSPTGELQGHPSFGFSLWGSHINPNAPGHSCQCTEARVGRCGLEEAHDLCGRVSVFLNQAILSEGNQPERIGQNGAGRHTGRGGGRGGNREQGP